MIYLIQILMQFLWFLTLETRTLSMILKAIGSIKSKATQMRLHSLFWLETKLMVKERYLKSRLNHLWMKKNYVIFRLQRKQDKMYELCSSKLQQSFRKEDTSKKWLRNKIQILPQSLPLRLRISKGEGIIVSAELLKK